jgi:hypothetical protein
VKNIISQIMLFICQICILQFTVMQRFQEFLTRIQTFNLQIISQKENINAGENQKPEIKFYDITHETPFYKSFSYKSELRVLKDMAFIDILTLDKSRIELMLLELKRVTQRFEQLWENYHLNYHDYHKDYKSSYPFKIKLNSLFIVYNLQSDSSDIQVSQQFVEDLADSIKLRESFLKELIGDISQIAQEKEQTAEKAVKPVGIETILKETLQSKNAGSQKEAPVSVNRYPTFKEGSASQFYNIVKPYFLEEDHAKLESLLQNNQFPESPLVFRDNGNKLADAFKQLYDTRLIVGCQLIDLEKWIAPNFLYLRNDGEQREFSEGYLNSMISTKSRPCKSPILKIDIKGNDFSIVPIPRHKK